MPFETAHGADISSWLQEHPDDARTLMEANAYRTSGTSRAVAEAYDFSGAGTVVDVGGGNGTLLLKILAGSTGTRGVIADIPTVAAEARNTVTERGMEGRCEVIECDFFEGPQHRKIAARLGFGEIGFTAIKFRQFARAFNPEELCFTWFHEREGF